MVGIPVVESNQMKTTIFIDEQLEMGENIFNIIFL